MIDDNPHADIGVKFPPDIPLLHGRITPEEQRREDEKKQRDQDRESENFFKERQVRAVESANSLAERNVRLTFVVAFISLGACCSGWYQGYMGRKSADTARDTLNQIRTDSQASSDQFQAQIHHFDASLGVNQVQLGKLDASIGQASRLAGATEKANDNVVQADRPWIGIGFIQPTNFTVGQIPVATFIFQNSGRRPAKVGLALSQSHYFETFPSDPPYPIAGIKSQSFVVPGAIITNKLNVLLTPLTQGVMDVLNSGKATLFVYAKIEYTDVLTNVTHYSHACYAYVPTTNGQEANFYGCTTYNDAK